MNPELPQVHPGAEAAPQIPGGVEYFPDGTIRSPELAPTYERQPAPVEQSPAPVATPPISAQPITMPQAPAPVDPMPDDPTPAIAGDDELMEKEGVDKVKKIIALTKGNPYEQARAIAALQKDYLKKRYDRDAGESNSQRLT